MASPPARLEARGCARKALRRFGATEAPGATSSGRARRAGRRSARRAGVRPSAFARKRRSAPDEVGLLPGARAVLGRRGVADGRKRDRPSRRALRAAASPSRSRPDRAARRACPGRRDSRCRAGAGSSLVERGRDLGRGALGRRRSSSRRRAGAAPSSRGTAPRRRRAAGRRAARRACRRSRRRRASPSDSVWKSSSAGMRASSSRPRRSESFGSSKATPARSAGTSRAVSVTRGRSRCSVGARLAQQPRGARDLREVVLAGRRLRGRPGERQREERGARPPDHLDGVLRAAAAEARRLEVQRDAERGAGGAGRAGPAGAAAARTRSAASSARTAALWPSRPARPTPASPPARSGPVGAGTPPRGSIVTAKFWASRLGEVRRLEERAARRVDVEDARVDGLARRGRPRARTGGRPAARRGCPRRGCRAWRAGSRRRGRARPGCGSLAAEQHHLHVVALEHARPQDALGERGLRRLEARPRASADWLRSSSPWRRRLRVVEPHGDEQQRRRRREDAPGRRGRRDRARRRRRARARGRRGSTARSCGRRRDGAHARGQRGRRRRAARGAALRTSGSPRPGARRAPRCSAPSRMPRADAATSSSNRSL